KTTTVRDILDPADLNTEVVPVQQVREYRRHTSLVAVKPERVVAVLVLAGLERLHARRHLAPVLSALPNSNRTRKQTVLGQDQATLDAAPPEVNASSSACSASRAHAVRMVGLGMVANVTYEGIAIVKGGAAREVEGGEVFVLCDGPMPVG